MHRFPFLICSFSILVGSIAFLQSDCLADTLTLKDGTILEGNIAELTGGVSKAVEKRVGFVSTRELGVIVDEMKRTFVSRKQILSIVPESDSNKYITFRLKHSEPYDNMRLSMIGQHLKVSPFNKLGERTILLKTPRREVNLKQHISLLTPKHAVISGLSSVANQSAIATRSIPLNILNNMLHNAIDQSNPKDHMAIVQFYLQAGYYFKAISELESLTKNFPNYEIDTEEIMEELHSLQAKDFLSLLKKRERAGQLKFAYKYSGLIPKDNLTPEVKNQVEEFRTNHKKRLAEVETCQFLIEDLLSELKDENIASSVAPFVTIIKNDLSIHSLDRLDSFVKLSSDTSLSVKEKLALALSGWILGNVNASTELKASIRYWETRFNILEYLKSESQIDRQTLLEVIKNTDDISASVVRNMIPQLPLPIESSEIEPLTISNIELSKKQGFPGGKYSVILPAEYNPHRKYPLLVVLRTPGRSTEKMIKWWSLKKSAKDGQQIPGPALEYGYIVIAPEYLSKESNKAPNSSLAKSIVVSSIQDVRKRFQVDSDRIFLTGHRLGGSTAFEIGLSRPDIFAGVIPITGTVSKHASRYRKNGTNLSWYVVSGELDRNTLTNNGAMLNEMMKSGTNMIYTQYLGRGYEPYYSEVYKILDWMEKQKRLKYPKNFKFKTIRPTDRRFFWYDINGIPPESSMIKVSRSGRQKASPKILSAEVTETNIIYLSSLKGSVITIWLSPDFVDFENKVSVMFKRHRIPKFKGFLEERIGVMLEDLRIRGDRQKLYSAKLVLK
jgi:enterochelin esterase-like enzyme